MAEQYKHSYHATEARPITETVTDLYFAEPTSRPTAFAEYFGDYFTLMPGPQSGIYRARRAGREDEYHYERGRLIRIVKNNSLKNFTISPL